MLLFQSTRPIRGATWGMVCRSGMVSYFNPRAPYGARLVYMRRELSSRLFQSTRPIRGATPDVAVDGIGAVISIHAPHTGRDGFSILSPSSSRTYFNPRAPYGARLHFCVLFGFLVCISIHAPHTGRDRKPQTISTLIKTFQSTRPIRGATFIQSSCCTTVSISIHAPHTGRDWLLRRVSRLFDISIHAPHTGRDRFWARMDDNRLSFQSTRPIRGATAKMHNLCSAFLQ